ncbi:PP13G phosphatase, partial [Polyodon spathula]|nr:PP13G phosphatase [Polyodon spathula]
MKDRRRAKSLPAYPEQATLFNNLTQSCRKRVQFADSLGLTLASVRHFSTTDDPQIPSKVFSRLQSFPPQQDRELLGDICEKFSASFRLNCLTCAFEQPGESCGFEERVREKRVSLEKVTASHFDICGLVRVFNFGLKKEVYVRYTFNDWLSFVDAQAMLVPGSATEGNAQTEQFGFTLYTPPLIDQSSTIQFAICYKTENGAEYWDNNFGQNYILRC